MPSYALYELVPQEGATPQFSPHVTKTQLALAYLGVPYTSQRLTFAQIHYELSQKCKNEKVTVPTLETDEGVFITDSWKIAEYLEEKYAKSAGKSLFGGPEGKAVCKFVEKFFDYAVWMEMAYLIGPRVWTTLSGPSAEYFVADMWSMSESEMQDRVDKMKDESYVKDHVRKAVRNLLSLEAMLQEQKNQGKANWINGVAPTHADFCVFGWYSFSRLNPDLVRMVWQNARLPRIQELIKGILDLGLVHETDLPQAIDIPIAKKSAL